MNLYRTLYIYLTLALVAIFHNLVHESMHYILARLSGVGILEFRFLTNGFLTSQVVYATPVDARTGAQWLLIGLGPTAITVLIGYTVYLLRHRLITTWPPLNLAIWYLGALFMTIDPVYIGFLSWFMQGSDANATETVGLPSWPVRIVAMALAVLGVWLVVQWRKEARTQVERYALRTGG